MRRIWLLRAAMVGLALTVPTLTALAQTDAGTGSTGIVNGLSPSMYEASVQALTQLAVIAVILEQALALIFDWKPFRETFDRRAVKPVVCFVFAVGIVHGFGLDTLDTLIKAYGGQQIGGGIVSKLVTALVLAGGSGGVNRIFQKLGIRSTLDLKDEDAPPPTMAFVSVVPMPRSAKTAVTTVTVVGIDSSSKPHSLGTVPGGSIGRDPTGWKAWFLQEKGRFPPADGFAIPPGMWTIRLDATDDSGSTTTSPLWGPYQLDAGARIDLTIKV